MKLLVFLLLPVVALANERLYQRFDKLYQQDIDKCLKKAQNRINKNPQQSIPYFFASKIYHDFYSSATKLSQRYGKLSRSISYGIQFEKKKDSANAQLANWDDFKSVIITDAEFLIPELREAEYYEKASKLETKIARLNGQKKRKTTFDHRLSSTNKTSFSGFKDGQFFGMPSGIERIASANLQGEQELLTLINKERKKQGMKVLIWDEDLANAARFHAFDLATQQYFDHTSHDVVNGKLVEVGSTFDRIKLFYKKSFVNSENIAAGNESPDCTYQQWYNSPGHFKNMFNSASGKVGIGVYYDEDSPYGYYWVFCTAY